MFKINGNIKYLLIVSLIMILSGCNGNKSTIDCRQDFTCFIDASKTCTPATVIFNNEVLGTKSSALLQMNGITEKKCIFYIETLNITLANSVPPDVAKQIQEMMVHKNGTCLFETTNLVTMLNNWNKGKFSTEDYSRTKCVGGYFELNNNGMKASVIQKGNSTKIKVSTGSSLEVCTFDSDCNSSLFCIQGECLDRNTIATLLTKVCKPESCTFNSSGYRVCEDKCDNTPCEGCTEGKFFCHQSSGYDYGDLVNNKCIECFSNYGCKEGYNCKRFMCVKLK